MVRKKIENLIETRQLMSYEAEFKTVKGNLRWAQAIGEVVEKDNKVIKIRGTFQDITERKNAEVKLKNAQSQLIHSEKMDAIGRMASGVAYEVKNPLGIVLQGINYFELETPSTQKDKYKMLQMMKNGIKRADNIVSALLDFSRFGSSVMKPEEINLMVESSLNLVEHNAKIKDIRVF